MYGRDYIVSVGQGCLWRKPHKSRSLVGRVRFELQSLEGYPKALLVMTDGTIEHLVMHLPPVGTAEPDPLLSRSYKVR